MSASPSRQLTVHPRGGTRCWKSWTPTAPQARPPSSRERRRLLALVAADMV